MKTIYLRAALLAAAAMGLTATGASAQATRTWVSGVGDDANPCSRTAPCKTFAGAISKTAIGGEIDVIDPGGFGAVTITKSITIDGAGTMASILNSSTNGVVINSSTANVILRNLSINGAGTGINGVRAISVASLHIENCEIFGNTGKGVDMEPNNANGILFIDNSTIEGNVGGGVLIKPTTPNTVQTSINNSRIERNSNYGIQSEDGTTTVVTRSLIGRQTGPGGLGIHATALAGNFAAVYVTDTTVSNNAGTGMVGDGAGTAFVRMDNVFVAGNTTGIGTNVNSFGNNHFTGNGSDGTVSGAVIAPK